VTRIETVESRQSEALTSNLRRRRHRRALALTGLGLSFFGTVGFWLAATGVVTNSISPPAGSPSNGSFATVTPLSTTVNRTNGGAQLQTGVALAKIVLSSAVTTSARVDVDWTNVGAAASILGNPNAQISIGLYYPIHTGNCLTSTPGSVDAPFINLTDTGNSTYCVTLDEGSTGRYVSSTGKLLLAQNQVGGYLIPSINTSTISACGAAPLDGSGNPYDVTGTPCQPASITDSNQRALWVIASIVTPGTIPQGVQPSLTTLSFFVGVKAS